MTEKQELSQDKEQETTTRNNTNPIAAKGSQDKIMEMLLMSMKAIEEAQKTENKETEK